MTDDANDADDRERAEAQALAQALAGGDDGGPAAPSDALETAGLLRYGAGGAELPEARSEALLAALLPHVQVQARPASRFAELRPWLRGGAALAIAAVVLLAVLRAIDKPSSSRSKPGQGPDIAAGAGLPAPPRSLLAAQAALARDRDKDARTPEAFDLEMRRYREQVLRALERAYPARVGYLEPRGRR